MNTYSPLRNLSALGAILGCAVSAIPASGDSAITMKGWMCAEHNGYRCDRLSVPKVGECNRYYNEQERDWARAKCREWIASAPFGDCYSCVSSPQTKKWTCTYAGVWDGFHWDLIQADGDWEAQARQNLKEIFFRRHEADMPSEGVTCEPPPKF